MNLSPEQSARFTSIINDFGDAFAQDRTDHRMHEWLAIIRNEMVDDWRVPLGHPELRNQLDWIDRILDAIEARRKSTVQHVATNLRNMMFPETRAAFQLN